jgi:hypothetical protein
VLLHLIELLDTGELHRSPKWQRVITTAGDLGVALSAAGKGTATAPARAVQPEFLVPQLPIAVGPLETQPYHLPHPW